ncbi:MAG: hypothetical protein C4586_08660 [Anaerolineaceae bacterium]|nr:MAG: hypothetical protein C4586_08660 [Anaerolineaceae bacterium]
MVILAFLQNMWVREPEKVRAWLDKNPHLWNRAVTGFLFSGCLTGRRIKACFGDLVEKMTFEECTREIAGDSRTICPPNTAHIEACIEKYKPTVVVTFGRIAAEAVRPIWHAWSTLTPEYFIALPHPAARQVDTISKLKSAANKIRRLCGNYIS